MTAVSIATILLAAGDASRYGGPKLLLKIDGVPMVRRAALAAVEAGTRVVVVTGAHRVEVEACLRGLDLVCTFNGSWREGMGGTIAHGVGHVRRAMPAASACLVMLADQPSITAADFERFVAAVDAAPQRILAARYGDIVGAPCLFPSRYFEELAGLSGDGGARVVIRRHADCIDEMPVPHAALDIDTPDDYLRYVRASAAGSPNEVPARERRANYTSEV